MPSKSSAARFPLTVLAVGAHPDDLEIGCTALLKKLIDRGHTVHLLVLTDDDQKSRRRAEALEAASLLNIPPARVAFAALPDGELRADRSSVARVRALTAGMMVAPDLVITHSSADSHNDHVATHNICHAAFRGTVFLEYSVHLSAELDRFAPRVFVDVPDALAALKRQLLMSHESQQERIGREDLEKYERSLGNLAQLSRAEGFEVSYQSGAQDVFYKTVELSDSPFHRFWTPVLEHEPAIWFYEGGRKERADSLKLRYTSRDALRSSFHDHWAPKYPIREQYGNSLGWSELAASFSVLLTGTSWDNRMVSKLYESSPDALWHIGRVGDSSGSFELRRRLDGKVLSGRPGLSSRGYGLICRLRNPINPERWLIYVGGTNQRTASAGLTAIANPGSYPDLVRASRDYPLLQVVYSTDDASDAINLIDVTLEGE